MKNEKLKNDNILCLNVLDDLPPGLLDGRVADLAGLLPGPTLIHLPGRLSDPLFVSVLLHGNEETGFDAVCEVLRRYDGGVLPRAMSLFIGNIAAAANGVRTLPGQTDYNRAWPGTQTPDCAEARLLQELVEHMRGRKPFASIDIHNNTGLNPHYACVTRLEQPFLHLARLFSRVVVYFKRPVGVQAGAFALLCPSVTLECGRIGTKTGVAHAMEFIDACLHLSHFPQHAVTPHDIELLRTFAIVKVPPRVSFSFDGSPADIRFRPDIDHLNFSPVPAGTSFGRVAPGSGAQLEVTPGGEDVEFEACFEYRDGEIVLTHPVVPAMLTRDPQAVRLDCLCYLMQRVDFSGGRME